MFKETFEARFEYNELSGEINNGEMKNRSNLIWTMWIHVQNWRMKLNSYKRLIFFITDRFTLNYKERDSIQILINWGDSSLSNHIYNQYRDGTCMRGAETQTKQ